jgi:hypothetical protein
MSPFPYPYPKPQPIGDGREWLVKTGSGERIFTDPELAWSAYYFAKFNYEKKLQSNETT